MGSNLFSWVRKRKLLIAMASAAASPQHNGRHALDLVVHHRHPGNKMRTRDMFPMAWIVPKNRNGRQVQTHEEAATQNIILGKVQGHCARVLCNWVDTYLHESLPKLLYCSIAVSFLLKHCNEQSHSALGAQAVQLTAIGNAYRRFVYSHLFVSSSIKLCKGQLQSSKVWRDDVPVSRSSPLRNGLSRSTSITLASNK